MSPVFQGYFTHLTNEGAVDGECPPQQEKKEQEENDKRDHRPYLDVVDVLQNFFVHDEAWLVVSGVSRLFSFDVHAQPLQV